VLLYQDPPLAASPLLIWHDIPPSLETFITNIKKIDLDQITLLPRTLTTLVKLGDPHTSSAPLECVRKLPPRLTRFQGLILPDCLSELPRTLYYYNSHIRGLIDPKDIPKLPPNLRYLSLSLDEVPDDLTSLPANLIELRCSDISERLFDLLPSSLKVLKINLMSFNGFPNSMPLSRLPQSLESLLLRSRFTIQPGDWVELPEHLTTLRITLPISNLESCSSAWLPPSLTELCLSANFSTHYKEDFEWAAHLPRSLRVLQLGLPRSSGFPGFDFVSLANSTPKLDSFKVRGSTVYMKNVSIPQFFSSLPKELREFHFQFSNFQPFDSDMRSLPRGLIGFTIADTSNLTSACVPYLPRYLHHLSLDRTTPDWFCPYSSQQQS
jgi:hypothetical protein